MIPQTGQHVKLFFRNGLIEEGIVSSWTPQVSVLKSLSSNNVLIIQNTTNDIIAIKVFADTDAQKKQEPDLEPVAPVYIDEDIDLTEPDRNIRLRALKLAELRNIRANEERQRARDLMTTFKNNGVGFSQTAGYGTPARLQEPTDIDPTKKNRLRYTVRNR